MAAKEKMQMTSEGFISTISLDSFAKTVDRLERACAERGLAIFARIDHAAAAAGVGLVLRPTVVLIVGNPRAGTPLMIAFPNIAIDLPLRVLVWEDNEGRVHLGTNDPEWFARRHSTTLPEEPQVKAMRTGLSALLLDAASDGYPETPGTP
jgi:uncharacterized protein (DUF302 family)